MLGQYTFNLKEIDASDFGTTSKYYGNVVGAKTTASQAGAIDLKAEKQMYSLKARLNIFCLEDLACATADSTVTFTLEHSEDNSTFATCVSAVIPVDALVGQNSPVFEITVPSNCHRYVRLAVKASAAITEGTLLIAIEPKN